MKISNINELKGSKDFWRRNPGLGVGGVRGAEPQCAGQGAVAGADGAKKSGARGVVVSLVCFRRRALDDDNLIGGCKALRDAIAGSLGIDDGDKRIRFEYSQQVTSGPVGTAVRICGMGDGGNETELNGLT